MDADVQAAIDKMILNFDPWAGDMDDDSVTLRDAFVVARKPAKCAICFDNILVGDRVRSQTQRSEQQRKVMTFKFCVNCCAAMARECADDGQSIEERYALGQKRAQADTKEPTK
jgi:hypothetical protein